ncbi:RHS repeat domain-containing protein [Culturomica massiliensis]|uniref:RHS repeat domain-containing protein n=1 Tax=Culturomica massiliensis TaxID=1841857 RepID=UPI0009F6FB74|nr:RHS repeat-associated core domain-containing protein [Culturomica massiliensis]
MVSGSSICYHLKDHLGSIRAIVDGSGRLLEENDYYAFGHRHPRSEHAQSSANRFKYNGKELQTVGGLGYLDYGARLYDQSLGRWFTTDPLSEKYYGLSPYVYCGNNPLNMIDPDGRDAIYIAFPKYRANGIPFTGYAGVLLIDNKTGLTKYYEYGRYDKEGKGLIRTVTISNVVIGKDGKPTIQSLNKVI